MTGHAELNYPAFHAHAHDLRRRGLRVISPHELNPPGRNWYFCMAVDLWAVLWCHEIALMPGWERSRGARIELALALLLGMRVRVMDA